jgi:hypothetical protein
VVFIHNGILLSHKEEIFSFAGNWMKLENIILSEVRLRRPKITCSPSYADNRPKTNAVILLDTVHTLCKERQGKGRKHKT